MDSMKNYDELTPFRQGLIKGQFLMIETMRLQVNFKSTHENMALTLNKIEKQLMGEDDE